MRPAWEGQLTEAFQGALAEYHRGVTKADCDFYHTTELGDGRVIAAEWDLRDHEARYIGGGSTSPASG